MNVVIDYFANHGSALLAGTSTMVLVGAVVRHRPQWPLSIEKLYYWIFDSAGEVISQKTGQPPQPGQARPQTPNPTPPAAPAQP